MDALAILFGYSHPYTKRFRGIYHAKTRIDLTDDSLIDLKYITNDSGFTAKYFYSLMKRGVPRSDKARQKFEVATQRLF
jgi:hypothetical protein